MKDIIKRLFDRFSNKRYEDFDNICNNPPSELRRYCNLEYTYKGKNNS